MSVRIYLAGGLALVDQDTLVSFHDLPGPKGIGIVAYLSINHLRPVSTSELADVLWDGSPPKKWRTSLKALVSRTRVSLELLPRVSITSGEGWYQLRLPTASIVDVLFAETSVHQAEAALAGGDPESAAPPAAVTAMIASRPILPEVGAEWVESVRRDVQAMHLRALDVLLQLWLGSAQYEQAIGDANRILGIDPLRESAYAALMSAHLATGRIGRGLAIYQSCRDVLSESVGASPGPAVEALYEKLLERSG